MFRLPKNYFFRVGIMYFDKIYECQMSIRSINNNKRVYVFETKDVLYLSPLSVLGKIKTTKLCFNYNSE